MNKENQKTKTTRFAGLNNKQIVVIYYKFKNYVDTTNEMLKENKALKISKSPKLYTTAKVSDKIKYEFINSLYYKTAIDIVETLKPIVEIIEDSDIYIKEQINNLK